MHLLTLHNMQGFLYHEDDFVLRESLLDFLPSKTASIAEDLDLSLALLEPIHERASLYGLL